MIMMILIKILKDSANLTTTVCTQIHICTICICTICSICTIGKMARQCKFCFIIALSSLCQNTSHSFEIRDGVIYSVYPFIFYLNT